MHAKLIINVYAQCFLHNKCFYYITISLLDILALKNVTLRSNNK